MLAFTYTVQAIIFSA